MKTHVKKCISCPKLVKDKYLAKLHVSTTSTTENNSDEASEIESWLFDFSTSSAKPIPKKPKQIDARSTLVHFADKTSTIEQEKLDALLVRAMYASGTPFCMVENSHWQTFFKAIRPAYVVPSRYEVSEPLLVSEYEKTREEMLIKVAESDAVAIIATYDMRQLSTSCLVYLSLFFGNRFILRCRGGVEDPRLEAKAKDTKKSEAKAKDRFSEDRHSRGQGQECSRPRTKGTSASALQKKKKKKVFTKIFQAISTKKRFPKNFTSAPQNFNNSKSSAVVEPSTGQFSRT